MKSPITYYGGKQKLASAIIEMIPEHKVYCEPFFGGGAVFFAKRPSFLECINDINEVLMTFYKDAIKRWVHVDLKNRRRRVRR